MKITRSSKELGDYGEELAKQFLEAASYSIIEQNFRCKIGELDIIAKHQEFLVFCEVKTRIASQYIHPTASVTQRKIKTLRKLGIFYTQKYSLYHLQPRFDVISIQVYSNQSPKIEHFINAL